MFKRINEFSLLKKGWFVLALSCLLLDGFALFCQYRLDLQPCLICVQQRALFLGLFILAMLGLALRKTKYSLLLLIGSMGVLGKIFDLGVKKVLLERHPPLFSTCSVEYPFPNWFPLHDWLPFMFQNYGDCSTVDFKLFGLSMSENLLIISGIMFLCVLLVFISKITKK